MRYQRLAWFLIYVLVKFFITLFDQEIKKIKTD
jgi:hypothetical protein